MNNINLLNKQIEFLLFSGPGIPPNFTAEMLPNKGTNLLNITLSWGTPTKIAEGLRLKGYLLFWCHSHDSKHKFNCKVSFWRMKNYVTFCHFLIFFLNNKDHKNLWLHASVLLFINHLRHHIDKMFYQLLQNNHYFNCFQQHLWIILKSLYDSLLE